MARLTGRAPGLNGNTKLHEGDRFTVTVTITAVLTAPEGVDDYALPAHGLASGRAVSRVDGARVADVALTR